ncbi:hypothetical protein V8E54_005713 [Elaphomyces granulatus]
MPSSKRVRTNREFNSAAVIEATGFPSPERCRRCIVNNTKCIVSSDVYRCSQCIRSHLLCSLASNKRFNVACEAYRSLAREISGARRRVQEAIAHLDVLERKWEHSVEHGLSRNCQSKALSSLELSGPSAIDCWQDSSFVAEDFPEGNTSSTLECSQDSSFVAEDPFEGNTSSSPSNSIPVPSSPYFSPITVSAPDDRLTSERTPVEYRAPLPAANSVTDPAPIFHDLSFLESEFPPIFQDSSPGPVGVSASLNAFHPPFNPGVDVFNDESLLPFLYRVNN